MRGKTDADWPQLVQHWKQTQEALRQRLIIRPLRPLPRYVAGADAAFSRDKATVFAAAVVYDRHERRVVEVRHATRQAEVPYVPGFLSFREGPAVLEAIRSLTKPFGAILFDAQGYAHPRRCGLAAHLSIELDMPGVGVAKSRLIGTHDTPAQPAGSRRPLMDGREQVGLVLRTRKGVRPVYVSVGHRVDLATAAELAMTCCTRYRLPEPTRQADIEVARLKVTWSATR
jgi:deoxyribonuclease V